MKYRIFLLFFNFLVFNFLGNDQLPYLQGSECNSNQSIMDNNAWNELQMDAFLAPLIKDQSKIGIAALKKLNWPVSDLQEIHYRQAIVKTLVEDNELFDNLRNFIDEFKQIYPDIFAYWDKHDALRKQSQSLYFSFFKKKLNTNELALEFAALVDIGKIISIFIAELGLVALCNELYDTIIYARAPRIANIKSGLFAPLRRHLPWSNLTEESFDEANKGKLQIETAGDHYVTTLKGISNVNSFITNLTFNQWLKKSIHLGLPQFPEKPLALFSSFSTIAVRDYLDFTNINHRITQIKTLKSTYDQLKLRMMNIARFFTLTSELTNELNKYSLFDKNEIKTLNITHNNAEKLSQNMQKLIKLLQTPTFKNSSSYFYSRGRILVANLLMSSVKKELQPLLSILGEIEAYVTIAQLYKEHEPLPARYCFATITSESKPSISLKNFWLPVISSETAITNSFAVGKVLPQNAIFNGPNWCGKSFAMRGIAYSVILSHAWGIAPAQEASLSLFSGFRTSLNIQDNVRIGASGFSSEKQRVEEIRAFIKNAQSFDKFFILIDEPITKTIADHAEQYVYNLGLELAQAKHCITLMSTNHKKPIKLIQDSLCWCGFYPEVHEVENGFYRTYKLQEGVAHWWFSNNEDDRAKRTRFIDWIGTN